MPGQMAIRLLLRRTATHSCCPNAFERLASSGGGERTKNSTLRATRRPLSRRWMNTLRKTKARGRSEEHTSELQSLMRISYAVFCLKKKKTRPPYTTHHTTQQKNILRTHNRTPEQSDTQMTNIQTTT